MAGAQNVSDLMYRTAKAVGDMAARRDWASVAMLREVSKSTERGIAAGKTEGEAGGGTVDARQPVPTPSGSRGPGVLDVRAHARTGDLSSEEYAEYRRELRQVQGLESIRLDKGEYARVVSEINTYLSDEDRKHALITKPIGNYRYTFINRGFSDYVFVDKVEID